MCRRACISLHERVGKQVGAGGLVTMVANIAHCPCTLRLLPKCSIPHLLLQQSADCSRVGGRWGRAGKFYLLLPLHVCASTAHMCELSFPLPVFSLSPCHVLRANAIRIPVTCRISTFAFPLFTIHCHARLTMSWLQSISGWQWWWQMSWQSMSWQSF